MVGVGVGAIIRHTAGAIALSPGLSMPVFVAWPAATLLAAGAVIVRRDV